MTGDLGTATIDSIAVLAAALPSDIKVFSLSAKAVVTVDVDVADMAIPYTIAIERSVLIKSVVNRRAVLPPMTPGTYRLSWSFAHVVERLDAQGLGHGRRQHHGPRGMLRAEPGFGSQYRGGLPGRRLSRPPIGGNRGGRSPYVPLCA
jgi:hypothetical protein